MAAVIVFIDVENSLVTSKMNNRGIHFNVRSSKTGKGNKNVV